MPLTRDIDAFAHLVGRAVGWWVELCADLWAARESARESARTGALRSSWVVDSRIVRMVHSREVAARSVFVNRDEGREPRRVPGRLSIRDSAQRCLVSRRQLLPCPTLQQWPA